MRIKHWFFAVILSARLLNAAEVPSQDAKPETDPSLAAEFLQAFKDPTGGNIYGLTYRLEQELNQPGDSADKTAQALLGVKSEIVSDREVLGLLDKIVEERKAPLAARLLLQIARAKRAPGTKEPPRVVVGQLIVEDGETDPTLVLAQMPILEDGYFAGEIGDQARPICFRAHGYQDLDVHFDGKDGTILYVGRVTLMPVPKDRQSSLKGHIAFDNPPSAKSPIVTLNVAMGPVNTPHNGFSGRTGWPEGLKIPASEAGEFQVDGLNPSDYNVIISANGHVDLNKKLTFTSGQKLKTDDLRLFSSDLGFYIGKPAPMTDELAWEPDFDTAMKRAQSEKKPLLVMMTATWCGPCQLLEKQTLNDPWIRRFLSAFVVVKAFEDRAVEKQYGLRGYPTLVFTDSTGKAVHTCVGYMPAFNFAAHCAQALRATSTTLPQEIESLIEMGIIKLP